jgi:hypothetical protein
VKKGYKQACILETEYGVIKYIMETAVTKKSLDKFLERYLGGTLSPSVKMEEINNNFDGDVMVSLIFLIIEAYKGRI